MRETAERLDAEPGPHPFRPTVDLGLRTNAVMRDWLQEQLDAIDDGAGRRYVACRGLSPLAGQPSA